MHALQIWIAATRPKTLPAGLCPALLGTALACKENFFHPWIFICTVLTALGIQISTNFANDYFDFIKGADTEKRKGPLRVTQAGLVSISKMKKAIFLSLGLTGLIGLYLVLQGGLGIALLLVLALALAVFYTAGPYSLAYRGLGDLFVFIFFGPVAVLGTYFLQTGSCSWEALLAGIGVGAISTAILCVNNLRDIEEDDLANKRTLAVRFGKQFAKMEYLVCLCLADLILCLSFIRGYYLLISQIFGLLIIPCVLKVFSYQDVKELNTVLANTGKLLVLYTLLFSLRWWIS